MPAYVHTYTLNFSGEWRSKALVVIVQLVLGERLNASLGCLARGSLTPEP